MIATYGHKAVLWIALSVIVGTEIGKRIWRSYHPLQYRNAGSFIGLDVLVIAVLIGALAAGLLWPRADSAPWFIAGPCIGGALVLLNAVFIAIVRFRWPDLAENIAGGRRGRRRGGSSIERRR